MNDINNRRDAETLRSEEGRRDDDN